MKQATVRAKLDRMLAEIIRLKIMAVGVPGTERMALLANQLDLCRLIVENEIKALDNPPNP